MQLWQHKNGFYYVLYGPGLKRRLSTGTRDRGEALKSLAQHIAAAGTPQIENPTFGQLLDHYESGHKAEVRAKGSLEYGVAKLRQHLGDFNPENMLPPVWKTYAKARKAEGVANGTILREIGVARAAFAWGVSHKTITAANVPVIKSPVKRPRPKEIWLRRDQARSLIQACLHPHVQLFVKLGLMTLARTAAILECRWASHIDVAGRTHPCVDLERRLIDYGEGFGNKRRALVPINNELLADLQAARRIARTDYVVEYQGQPVKWIKNAFSSAVERAGLPDNITPHVLRHTGATWLVEDGVPIEEIAKMMGDTVEMVENVYGHHSPAFLKRAAASLQLEK